MIIIFKIYTLIFCAILLISSNLTIYGLLRRNNQLLHSFPVFYYYFYVQLLTNVRPFSIGSMTFDDLFKFAKVFVFIIFLNFVTPSFKVEFNISIEIIFLVWEPLRTGFQSIKLLKDSCCQSGIIHSTDMCLKCVDLLILVTYIFSFHFPM